jgi:hypothetical protein
MLFLAGFLAMQLYKKAKRTYKASLLAATIFMISITPQAGLPKMYFGLLALFFALLQYRNALLKPHIKLFHLFVFIVLHIAKYIKTLSFSTYVLSAIANLIFCSFAASGIDILLVPKEALKKKIISNSKKYFLILLPLFYFALLYFRIENKQIFFFVASRFNIVCLGLLLMFYISYLLDRALQEKEPIYLRLFIATMLESLTVSYLL